MCIYFLIMFDSHQSRKVGRKWHVVIKLNKNENRNEKYKTEKEQTWTSKENKR